MKLICYALLPVLAYAAYLAHVGGERVYAFVFLAALGATVGLIREVKQWPTTRESNCYGRSLSARRRYSLRNSSDCSTLRGVSHSGFMPRRAGPSAAA